LGFVERHSVRFRAAGERRSGATVPSGQNPVGITYDRTTGDVWVAVYTGQILVYADR
jgi:DNA-binding beta-propeller fold protein YncE